MFVMHRSSVAVPKLRSHKDICIMSEIVENCNEAHRTSATLADCIHTGHLRSSGHVSKLVNIINTVSLIEPKL